MVRKCTLATAILVLVLGLPSPAHALAKETVPLTLDYLGLQFLSGLGMGGVGALLGQEVGSVSGTLLEPIVGESEHYKAILRDLGGLGGLIVGIVWGVHAVGTQYGVSGNLQGALLGAFSGVGLIMWSWSQPWLVVEGEGAPPKRFYRPEGWWRPFFRFKESIPPECAQLPPSMSGMIRCPAVPGFINPLTAGVLGALIGYNLGAQWLE